MAQKIPLRTILSDEVNGCHGSSERRWVAQFVLEGLEDVPDALSDHDWAVQLAGSLREAAGDLETLLLNKALR